ncbi:MAG: hypothetical protein ACRC6T_08475 [Sarcina sp.]
MRDSIELSKKNFYIIVMLCATIILMVSLETILMVKDNNMFELWTSNPNLINKININDGQETYSIYLTMCLSMFFIKVITPVAFAINTYLALIKLRISKLFVQTWVILLIGLFTFVVLMEKFYSIFFIINAGAYLLLVIMMIYFWVAINKRKNEQILESIQKS